MRLQHIRNHISINYFEPIEIENFTILTGLNGSGKTHLLEAIKMGNVEIENIDKSEIVYYNYNDFTIFTGNPQQNPNYNNRKNEWTNTTNLFIQRINELKQNVKDKFLKNKTPIEILIFNRILNRNFNSEISFGIDKDYEILEELKKEKNIRSILPHYRNKFTQQFYVFLSQYLINDNMLTSLNKDYIREKIELFSKELDIALKEEDKKIDTNSIGKSIFLITQNDFESPNFFLEDIANEEKEYQFKKTNNLLNKLKATEWNQKTSYLENNDFIEKFGLSPVEQINEVLNEYNCNGYFLATNDFQATLGLAKEKINVDIKLKQKDIGYTTTFDQLSSGEKTLITLSLLIYKSRKKKIIPRVLLLDEIDSSLHPSMIKRLINVIQELFIKQQNLKVIFATHSPTTIALADENCIYVVNKEGQNRIEKQTKQEALKILTEGFITLEEGLRIFDQTSKKELTIFTEGNNISFIKKSLELLEPKLLDRIDIIDNLKDRSGKNQLKTLFDFFTKMPHKNKVLFIYDCDVTTSFTDENNTYGFIFTNNLSNTKVKKGIENLFSEEHFKSEFYPLKEKEDGGIQSSLDKTSFEKYILDNSSAEMFVNFKPLINKIKGILDS